MPDYLKAAAAFRAKAAATNFPEEAKILIAKAEELETKYGNANSRSTDDTTITSRDGRTFHWEWDRSGEWITVQEFFERARQRQRAEQMTEDLLRNQYKWNDKYYDKDGNPKPQEEADIVEEEYQTQADDDEDYDPTGEWYNA